MTVQAHALDVLEFARLLDHVAGQASSPPGAARIRALRPVRVGALADPRTSDTLDALHRELTRVAAMRVLTQADEPFRPEAIPELEAAISRLRVEGAAWTGLELLGAVVLLRSSRRTQIALRRDVHPMVARAALAPLADRLIARQAIEQQLERVLTEDGTLKDDASPALRKIRRELRSADSELVKLLEKLMGKLEAHHRVDDASVTLRNGRYVIPVRREGRVSVGGIVHDTSQSGQTVFVEPPAAVEAGNRIRELEAEERTECERIFRELTDLLRPEREALAEAWDALVTLDSLYGRARYAGSTGCSDATLVPARAGFHLRNARHPLLLAQGIAVVPFDLAMEPAERTLLVSGPNTGGKTVLLKALALISLMVQSGIPAPVGAESTVPCFDDVFADIGDEQSLEASLSTFSAHLKHLTEIIERASAESLVLIDELGSGTDPLEGAALGGAILESLTRRGTTTISTTHLGALKELAGSVPGVVNASLQFDSERLAPTYRLIKGVPGRSYGIAIARRLKMPEEVLRRAEERVPQMERDLAALLADVEARATLLEARERDATQRLEDAERRAELLGKREQVVQAKEREMERSSRAEARRYLLEARQEVERTIRELKEAGGSAIDQLAVEARRGIEARAAAERDALDALDALEALDAREAEESAAMTGARRRGDAREGARSGNGTSLTDDATDVRGVALAIGDAVEVSTLGGKTGRLLERRGDEAVVAVGVMKMTVPFGSLRRLSARHLRESTPGVVVVDSPDIEASTEVDVRGVRVHEVDGLILGAIDNAIRADLASLRIIHGKGTGALRERVTQLLKGESRVKSARLGAWNEGGAGVTMIEFR